MLSYSDESLSHSPTPLHARTHARTTIAWREENAVRNVCNEEAHTHTSSERASVRKLGNGGLVPWHVYHRTKPTRTHARRRTLTLARSMAVFVYCLHTHTHIRPIVGALRVMYIKFWLKSKLDAGAMRAVVFVFASRDARLWTLSAEWYGHHAKRKLPACIVRRFPCANSPIMRDFIWTLSSVKLAIPSVGWIALYLCVCVGNLCCVLFTLNIFCHRSVVHNIKYANSCKKTLPRWQRIP